MNGLLQLSGVIVDLVYRVEQVPLAGEEAIVSGFHMSAGGGFNAMVAARRSGMQVTYGGCLGSGPLADIVSTQLRREGISTAQSKRSDCDQGCCTVLVDCNGERTFIAKEGAEGAVSLESLNAGCTQRSLAALSGVLMADSGYFSAIVSHVVFQLSQ